MSSRPAPRGGRGGFSSPSRGGGGGGTIGNRGTERNNTRGGGGATPNKPKFGSPAPSRQLSDFASPIATPKRPSTGAQTQTQSGSKKNRFGTPTCQSPYKPHQYGSPVPPSSLVSIGDFSIDQRTYGGGSISISIKFGQMNFKDSHLEAIVLPWFETHFITYLIRNYSSYTPQQIQVNIELQDNDLTSLGVSQLCDYLSKLLTHPTTCLFRLTALKLWNNAQIDDRACEAISQLMILLARCDAPLLELHLSHCLITARGAAALMNAVYEYSRPDTTLTRLKRTPGDKPLTIGAMTLNTNLSSPSPSSSSSSSTRTPFLLPPTCIDTGVLISPPTHPLWLRLEWNSIDYGLFQRFFHWINLEPAGLKRTAKKLRRAEEKAAKITLMEKGTATTPAKQVKNANSGDEDDEDEGEVAGDQEQEQESDGDDEDDADDGEDDGDEIGDEPLPAEQDTNPDVAIEPDTQADATDDMPDIQSLSINDADHPSLPPSTADASSSPSSSPTKKSPPFPLPGPTFRICPASNRQLCSVRMCKFSQTRSCDLHLCFFNLQHQSYESSDLLQVLRKQKQLRSMRKLVKPFTMNDRASDSITSSNDANGVAPDGVAAAPPVTGASPNDTPSLPFDSPSVVARPLVLFLDTNSVFNMISSRGEIHHFDWNHLYELARRHMFGSGFEEEDRHVYLVLCSAVLNEIDARKEYNKRSEGASFGSQQKFQHLSTLSKQIKEQFQLNLPDQSQGFLARCSNMGGWKKGFLKTISIAQGEMNIHPSMRPSPFDSRNTSNDRRILNAGLHWSQTVGESGIVVLCTDDRNLQNISQAEGLPVVSLFALDRALGRTEYVNRPLDSILLRHAIASCSQDLQSSMSNMNIQPSIRMDKNVYECLQEAVDLVTNLLSNPTSSLDRSEAELKLECWRGVLANAPQLLSAIRHNRVAQAATRNDDTKS